MALRWIIQTNATPKVLFTSFSTDLKKTVGKLSKKTPQIEKNKEGEQDLKIEVQPIVNAFYNNKETD